MIGDEERRDLDEALKHYPSPRSAAITGLKVMQRHRRWLSDETLADLSCYLDVSVDELDTLATFYNLLYRKPVGRHVILVCDSMVCWALGQERLVRALEDELDVDLGGTTADGRFTLLPVVCLGACDQAPAMLIDDDLYGPVQPEQVRGILETYE